MRLDHLLSRETCLEDVRMRDENRKIESSYRMLLEVPALVSVV